MRWKRDTLTPISQSTCIAVARLPRLSVHGYCRRLLPLVTIFTLICSSVEATNDEAAKNKLLCFDSERNTFVRKHMCRCCTYKGEDGTLEEYNYQNETHSNTTAYCGSLRVCGRLQSRWSQAKHGTSSALHPMLAVSILLAIVLLVMTARLIHNSYVKFNKIERLKLKEIEVRKHLDAEFPPTTYRAVNDPECQLQEDELCCVCLDGLEGTIVRKLHCSHVLHKACFDRWCVHLSDVSCGQARRQNLTEIKPEESLWVCPLCKHPAMPDMEQMGVIPATKGPLSGGDSPVSTTTSARGSAWTSDSSVSTLTGTSPTAAQSQSQSQAPHLLGAALEDP